MHTIEPTRPRGSLNSSSSPYFRHHAQPVTQPEFAVHQRESWFPTAQSFFRHYLEARFDWRTELHITRNAELPWIWGRIPDASKLVWDLHRRKFIETGDPSELENEDLKEILDRNIRYLRSLGPLYDFNDPAPPSSQQVVDDTSPERARVQPAFAQILSRPPPNISAEASQPGPSTSAQTKGPSGKSRKRPLDDVDSSSASESDSDTTSSASTYIDGAGSADAESSSGASDEPEPPRRSVSNAGPRPHGPTRGTGQSSDRITLTKAVAEPAASSSRKKSKKQKRDHEPSGQSAGRISKRPRNLQPDIVSDTILYRSGLIDKVALLHADTDAKKALTRESMHHAVIAQLQVLAEANNLPDPEVKELRVLGQYFSIELASRRLRGLLRDDPIHLDDLSLPVLRYPTNAPAIFTAVSPNNISTEIVLRAIARLGKGSFYSVRGKSNRVNPRDWLFAFKRPTGFMRFNVMLQDGTSMQLAFIDNEAPCTNCRGGHTTIRCWQYRDVDVSQNLFNAFRGRFLLSPP